MTDAEAVARMTERGVTPSLGYFQGAAVYSDHQVSVEIAISEATNPIWIAEGVAAGDLKERQRAMQVLFESCR